MHFSFDFRLPRSVLFGPGRFREAGAQAARLGSRVALLIGGSSLARSGRLSLLEEQLREQGLDWLRLTVVGEPTVSLVDEAAHNAREFGCDCVLAVGGGSVLDAGKAVAALVANGGEVLDYLEGVGRGKGLDRPAVPQVCVPTTAGTGSEATKNAVITDDQRRFKKSMRSDGLLPTIALVDSDLLSGCPPATAAACGMDAITQLLESYVARKASPLTDALALQGLFHGSRLPALIRDRDDVEARDSMALASLIGGMCLANAGLGVVHGLASSLGAFFDAPHGAICAALLAPSVRLNTEVASKVGNRELLDKYCMVFDLLQVPSASEDSVVGRGGLMESLQLLGDPACSANRLADHLSAMQKALGIPGLAHYGVEPDDFPRIITEAGASNLRNNPVELDQEQLHRLLEMAL